MYVLHMVKIYNDPHLQSVQHMSKCQKELRRLHHEGGPTSPRQLQDDLCVRQAVEF